MAVRRKHWPKVQPRSACCEALRWQHRGRRPRLTCCCAERAAFMDCSAVAPLDSAAKVPTTTCSRRSQCRRRSPTSTANLRRIHRSVASPRRVSPRRISSRLPAGSSPLSSATRTRPQTEGMRSRRGCCWSSARRRSTASRWLPPNTTHNCRSGPVPAFCEPGESLVGCFCLGTPVRGLQMANKVARNVLCNRLHGSRQAGQLPAALPKSV